MIAVHLLSLCQAQTKCLVNLSEIFLHVRISFSVCFSSSVVRHGLCI